MERSFRTEMNMRSCDDVCSGGRLARRLPRTGAATLLFVVACTTGRMDENKIDALMRDYECASRLQPAGESDRLKSVLTPTPGASVIVVRHGRVLFRKSYGMANLEEGIASTPDTNYRLASVTKQFTAAAILLLAESGATGSQPVGGLRGRRSTSQRGKLSIDDPITKYLTLPPYANAITLRHLLTHTSGLLAYEDLIPPGTTKQLKDADVLHLLQQQDTTYFAPGTHYRYSNTHQS